MITYHNGGYLETANHKNFKILHEQLSFNKTESVLSAAFP